MPGKLGGIHYFYFVVQFDSGPSQLVDDGMRQLSIPDEVRGALFASLAKVHISALRTGDIPVVKDAPAPAPEPAPVAVEDVVSLTASEEAEADAPEAPVVVAGLVPLVVPITLIAHHVRHLGIEYLAGQTYLEPHPKELMLRNHV